jgi:hypothetical protein
MSACSVKSGVDLAIISQGGSQVATVRNNLVRSAQRSGAEWLLFIDDDMIFPAHTLMKLLFHNKDIVGVICSMRGPPYRSIGRVMDGEIKTGLARAYELGTGVLLVRMSVFDRMPSPWFKHTWEDVERSENNPDGELSEDLYFIREIQKRGTEVWCDLDLSLEIGHVGDQVFAVTRNQQHGGIGSLGPLPEKQGWKRS